MTRSIRDRARAERIREAAMSIPCERCGARPGEPCKTKNGFVALAEHVDRRRLGIEIVRAEDHERTKINEAKGEAIL